MPTVTYRLNDGSEKTITAEIGENLMEIATHNGIVFCVGRDFFVIFCLFHPPDET